MSTTPNRDGWVEACVLAMGEARGSLFGLLCKDLWELNREYETYVRLFGPHNKHFALLNESAPDFFGLTQRLLFDSLALRIARLADPAASNRGIQPNLTMESDVRKLIKYLRAAEPEIERQRKVEDAIIGGWHVVATNSIELPESIVRAAELQAGPRGVSVEEWISRAVVERLDTAEDAREYFRNRAAGARRGALLEALDAVPDNPPDPGDEL